MVKCARCDCEADHIQKVTPDVITKEVIDSIELAYIKETCETCHTNVTEVR